MGIDKSEYAVNYAGTKHFFQFFFIATLSSRLARHLEMIFYSSIVNYFSITYSVRYTICEHSSQSYSFPPSPAVRDHKLSRKPQDNCTLYLGARRLVKSKSPAANHRKMLHFH